MSMLLLIGGCGASSRLNSAQETTHLRIEAHAKKSGGHSLAVAGQTITYRQIKESLIEHNTKLVPLAEHLKTAALNAELDKFKDQGWPEVRQIVMNKVFYIVLYNQAKKDLGENIDLILDREVDNQVREYVADNFGDDNAAAEQQLKDQGSNWRHFKKVRKNLILIASQLPKARPLTYSELAAAYDDLKAQYMTQPASITIRLIDIQPALVQPADPNQSQVQYARSLADDLIRRISGGEDFGELAKQHSHGHRKAYGGLWKPRDPNALAEPYDILAQKAHETAQGQIAGPIETKAGDHIFVMRLEEKRLKTTMSLSEVQRQLENKIKYDRRKVAADEIDANLAEYAQLAQTEEFVELCLEEIYLEANQ
jgi:hypothetical protein